MNKILYCGDPHATPDSLDEMWNLIKYIKRLAVDNKVNTIVFLGDQYHTHSILHLSVINFWNKAFEFLKTDSEYDIYCLVGNHDRSGNSANNESAMMIHKNVLVIDEPMLLNGIVYLPYYSKKDDFLEAATIKAKTLVCHQTFDGSKYENGFYAQDGVNPNLLDFDSIISGHIHTEQKFGKVWYVGSPRWRTVSDANVSKAVYIVNHDDDGAIIDKTPYSTEFVCKPIYHYIDTKEEPVSVDKSTKASITVDIKGSVEYVNKRKIELEKLGCRVRTFPERNFTFRAKESDGIATAFVKFLEGFTPKYGTNKQDLLNISKSKLDFVKNG